MNAPPPVIPVFPLTGVLLLPGMWLPLHIFEERYRNMIEDAQAAGGFIGMVQPVVPRQDNRPPPEAAPENPELYRVGCVGRLEQCDRTPDGRFNIQLLGVTRFQITAELPLHRGYRRVEADYAPYTGDAGDFPPRDTGALLQALLRFGQSQQFAFDTARLKDLPGAALINGLSMSLPFGPAEKQALLEAPGLAEREALLLTLMGMGLPPMPPQDPVPPTLN
jgi:Lon protease-like protein